jgi:hypothetical protein
MPYEPITHVLREGRLSALSQGRHLVNCDVQLSFEMPLGSNICLKPELARDLWEREAPSKFRQMKLTAAIALLLTCASVLAKDFRWRVHYTIGGSAHDALVPAESSAQARREVMNMFPGAVIMSVSQIK